VFIIVCPSRSGEYGSPNSSIQWQTEKNAKTKKTREEQKYEFTVLNISNIPLASSRLELPILSKA
jgi:hypothetical protein